MNIKILRLSVDRSTSIALTGIFCIFLVILFTFLLPSAVDWSSFYRPAAQALISGASPFDVKGYCNAPWVLLPILPLLLLPEAVGRAIIAVATLVTLALLGRHFGATPVGILFLLLSPPVLQLMLDGNIDWLVAIGFILPPQIGLFFLAVKPQIGLVVGIFWLVEAWRKNGIREVVRVFAPVCIALAASFLLYGFWIRNYFTVVGWKGNTSLWPVSLPIGLALAVTAIRKRKLNYAVAASPCLTPYLLLHSWIGPLLAIISSTPELIAAVIGMWGLVIIRAMGG